VNSMNRRTFLKGSLAGSVVAVAAAAGLLTPSRVLAAAWPQAAFGAKTVDDALKALYGTSDAPANAGVKIKAQPQAENGAVVPIAVVSTLPKVEGIAIFVVANNTPLVANVGLTGAEGYFSCRMKMSKTSDVKVVVKSQGKLYSASQQIKVTVGGCGG